MKEEGERTGKLSHNDWQPGRHLQLAVYLLWHTTQHGCEFSCHVIRIHKLSKQVEDINGMRNKSWLNPELYCWVRLKNM